MAKLFIGAENIISPLGNGIKENFSKLKDNVSGITVFKNAGFNKEDICLSKIPINSIGKYDFLLDNCLKEVRKNISPDIISSGKSILILSTTKGDIEKSLIGTIENSAAELQTKFSLKHFPVIISNGCASGVIAINTAANLIRAGIYDNAIIVGCDVISDFVLYGFQSLFAISDKPCIPFDKNRKGITLGEGCAAVVLSKNNSIFHNSPMEYIDGTSSNDANHISGPSRTGEGLVRTVKNTLALADINEKEIDFISAHGTGTIYNDDMESIAFDRLGMNHIPLNSLKGYFGHTLGAAGVIETAVCLQSMRNNILIKSLGFQERGTVKQLNIIFENIKQEVRTVLKTASGFGGCNASFVLKKI